MPDLAVTVSEETLLDGGRSIGTRTQGLETTPTADLPQMVGHPTLQGSSFILATGYRRHLV